MIDHNRPIVFLDTWNHNEMERMVNEKATSAGFVDVYDDKVKCYGNSISLNLKPAKDDEHWIASALGLGEE